MEITRCPVFQWEKEGLSLSPVVLKMYNVMYCSQSNLDSQPRSKVLFLSNDDTLSSDVELAICCCVNLLRNVGLGCPGCPTSCKDDGGVVSDELLDALMV